MSKNMEKRLVNMSAISLNSGQEKPAAEVWKSDLAGGITLKEIGDPDLPEKITETMDYKVMNKISASAIPKCLPEPIDSLV